MVQCGCGEWNSGIAKVAGKRLDALAGGDDGQLDPGSLRMQLRPGVKEIFGRLPAGGTQRAVPVDVELAHRDGDHLHRVETDPVMGDRPLTQTAGCSSRLRLVK